MHKNYKFVYLPEDKSVIREYNFTRWKFITLALFIIFLFGAGAKFTVDFLTKARDHSTIYSLENRNQIMKTQ